MKPTEESEPCPCEACDEYNLAGQGYCTQCIHHGCNFSTNPQCPPAQRSPKWCDECSRPIDDPTTVNGSHLCKNCLKHTSATRDGLLSQTCSKCNSSIDEFPIAFEGDTVVETPEDTTAWKMENNTGIYHKSCWDEIKHQKRRQEQNKSLTDF